MQPHHLETIARVKRHFESEPEVRAVMLGGSLAHGFGRPDSDVDIQIVIGEPDYARRVETGELTFFSPDLATYTGGYVDGKYTTAEFIGHVARAGSEPARFAYADAQLIFSRDESIGDLIVSAARYPSAEKVERIGRFHAQLEAWRWYVGEALRHDNTYLLNHSIQKLVLFGGRMLLAHNEILYPYHKWFLRVLQDVPDRPADLMDRIAGLYARPALETAEAFVDCVKTFRDWETPQQPWPNQFMLDSELNWMTGPTPIDDL
ncbi:MAG TPA: nucleotidyltransferase domain-containing protein [Anaerolineales bacterium]|nr:nucleotidyltransferase domain-containing protein [Anaerolineales bacterium]